VIRSRSGISDERFAGEDSMVRPKRRKADTTVTGEHCHRFGTIAVHKGFVSLEDVKSAIGEQIDDDINGREHRLLGSILYENGFLTEDQIDTVLQELKKTL
jgi:hypothetical protein